MASFIRLFLDQPLGPGQSVSLSRQQVQQLFGVLQLETGAHLRVFNGKSGEWAAIIKGTGEGEAALEIGIQSAPQRNPPDLWLLFSPIEKARTDFIVEKATELGAARLLPVQTEFTNSKQVRRGRLQAHAVEAAEQCGGTFVPEVDDLVTLNSLLDNWPEGRQLLFCDETLAGQTLMTRLTEMKTGPWAILIGPEGGFSAAERQMLRALPFAHAISLGPRILRADTAAVVAMTLWQSALGDWS